MEEYLEMRKKPKTFQFFCEQFLRVVVGKNQWKDGRIYYNKVSKVATVSDEAMALLHLENSFDYWKQSQELM
jgi:hypothetical protein